MSFLFWERIYRVIQYVERRGKMSKVMDFGCGGGVMLPILSPQAEAVLAVDIDLAPSQKMSKFIPLGGNVTFATSYAQIPPCSLDLILALDVLEHVDDLNVVLVELCSRLSPGGEIIVSAPSENFAYKIGRRLAGSEYSGDYHVRNIYHIRQSLRQFVDVRTVAALFAPIPFFIVLSGAVKR